MQMKEWRLGYYCLVDILGCRRMSRAFIAGKQKNHNLLVSTSDALEIFENDKTHETDKL